MAALDAARARGGCMGQTEDPAGAAAGEAAASLQRNGASLSYLTAGAVEIGREERVGGVRTFVADNSTRADSVRITLRRPIPAKLVPIFSAGPGGTMSVTAAATMRPIVSFDVGSTLANVSSPIPGQVLPSLFGLGGGVDVLGPGGLVGATVTLGDLALAANAGSVQDFLDTETTAPALLNAIADALGATTDAAVKTTLAALANGGETSHTVLPREVLGVPAGGTADDAIISVSSLVGALGEAANGDNLLNLTLPINVPLLGGGELGLRLVELARPAIGPAAVDASGNPLTSANTAQGVVTASLNVGRVLDSDVNVKVFAQLAAASGGVASLQCSQRGRPHPTVTIDAQTSAIQFGIGEISDVRLGDPQAVTVARLPAGIELKAKMIVSLGSNGEQALRFDGPFPAPPQTIGADPSDMLANGVRDSDVEVEVVGEGLASAPAELINRAELLKNALRPALAAAARRIGHDVIGPALSALGGSLGDATVTVHSVSVDQPLIYAR
ncbi:MAG TPA: TadG family pilus assembly protein [Nevskiaceae bacterium]|nr:TadG family pilus assembly protein [Nevskiaceae bacterium]